MDKLPPKMVYNSRLQHIFSYLFCQKVNNREHRILKHMILYYDHMIWQQMVVTLVGSLLHIYTRLMDQWM